MPSTFTKVMLLLKASSKSDIVLILQTCSTRIRQRTKGISSPYLHFFDCTHSEFAISKCREHQRTRSTYNSRCACIADAVVLQICMNYAVILSESLRQDDGCGIIDGAVLQEELPNLSPQLTRSTTRSPSHIRVVLNGVAYSLPSLSRPSLCKREGRSCQTTSKDTSVSLISFASNTTKVESLARACQDLRFAGISSVLVK
eukprot:767785-Hanusia_phi.AAC.7